MASIFESSFVMHKKRNASSKLDPFNDFCIVKIGIGGDIETGSQTRLTGGKSSIDKEKTNIRYYEHTRYLLEGRT